MPSLTMSSTMPRIKAVMKIIAQVPTAIAANMIRVRRWLRHKLRQARRKTILRPPITRSSSPQPAPSNAA